MINKKKFVLYILILGLGVNRAQASLLDFINSDLTAFRLNNHSEYTQANAQLLTRILIQEAFMKSLERQQIESLLSDSKSEVKHSAERRSFWHGMQKYLACPLDSYAALGVSIVAPKAAIFHWIKAYEQYKHGKLKELDDKRIKEHEKLVAFHKANPKAMIELQEKQRKTLDTNSLSLAFGLLAVVLSPLDARTKNALIQVGKLVQDNLELKRKKDFYSGEMGKKYEEFCKEENAGSAVDAKVSVEDEILNDIN